MEDLSTRYGAQQEIIKAQEEKLSKYETRFNYWFNRYKQEKRQFIDSQQRALMINNEKEFIRAKFESLKSATYKLFDKYEEGTSRGSLGSSLLGPKGVLRKLKQAQSEVQSRLKSVVLKLSGYQDEFKDNENVVDNKAADAVDRLDAVDQIRDLLERAPRSREEAQPVPKPAVPGKPAKKTWDESLVIELTDVVPNDRERGISLVWRHKEKK
ncbi:hypothetical protein SBDP1_1600005 [Syntrophobacter sp. SbD1]|nr:hypothetical protein SBDP1_1600005 [Syntrophobacter sp. SbD1]